MYQTNWNIRHKIKDILEAHEGPFTGEGHKGLYEILTNSWQAQPSLFVHHTWTGGFCICGAGVHSGLFMVRDYNPK